VKPDDWFFRQRAFPLNHIPLEAQQRGFAQAVELQSLAREPNQDGRATSRNAWVPAGPTNIGGRITALGVHPDEPNRIFAGAADGGVLRSLDGGTTWEPLTDDFPSLSIGAIAMDPVDPDIIYVGTGEANAAGDTYAGTGIYRSTDGGDSWEWLGLPSSYKIGRIVVSPLDSQDIFVAVMGGLYANNPERGVYRTDDGGQNWERCLYVSDSTGAIDVAVNPQDPQILYAAMWERWRRPHDRHVGGITSGIYRSTNGGDTWTQLFTGLPTPSTTVGRIGLSLCASQPDVLYAIYADHPGYFLGAYKTVNGGDTWTQLNDGAISDVFSSFGWYFGNIRVAPSNPNHVYALGVPLYRSTNGGAAWDEIGSSVHVDRHALYISPDDPNYLIDGNDGGVYVSTNLGDNWTKSYNLPITQFYAITFDVQQPQRLYGGTQDNSTMRTLTGNLNDWDVILGGDGFYVNVDYTNSNTIYAEYQWGWLFRSLDGGYSFDGAMDGINGSDRRNWSTPVVMDPSDPQTLYYGTYRVYQTTNGADSWSAMSGDLTGGEGSGGLTYGTITTIDPSPADPDYVYVGTDDARVWVTTNGGGNWTRIDGGLPERWVTRVAGDPFSAQTAYVTLSGYRNDEFLPHVFRTTNAGMSWVDVSSNLPEIPVNDIVVDPDNPATLFVATDAGVFVSFDTGGEWFAVGGNLPNCAVHDLALDPVARSLIAGTHGRSMFRYDLQQLSSVEEESTGFPGTDTQTPSARMTIRPRPNPFSPGGEPLTVRYTLTPESSLREEHRLLVLDTQGRLIRTLVPGRFARPGVPGTFEWDGRDDAGRSVATGAYMLRAEAGARVATSRLIVSH